MAKDTPTDFDKGYHTLYRCLKKIGLTPHDLRKLNATKLVELGAQEADLMKAMGWRSSAMAALYVQAGRQKQIQDKLRAELNARVPLPAKEGKANAKQVFGKVPASKRGRPTAKR